MRFRRLLIVAAIGATTSLLSPAASPVQAGPISMILGETRKTVEFTFPTPRVGGTQVVEVTVTTAFEESVVTMAGEYVKLSPAGSFTPSEGFTGPGGTFASVSTAPGGTIISATACNTPGQVPIAGTAWPAWPPPSPEPINAVVNVDSPCSYPETASVGMPA